MKRKRPESRPANCAYCGEEFISRPTYLGMTKYCSHRCGGEARRKPVTRLCTVCGTSFETVPSRTKRTCSEKCSRVAKSRSKLGERNPNYVQPGEHMRDRWWAARAECCAKCGLAERLQIHHVVYEQEIRRRGGDRHDPRVALTLCLACHTRHHRRTEGSIELTLLPASAYEYAEELMGAGAAYEYLRRRYIGEDERLDRLFKTWERAA